MIIPTLVAVFALAAAPIHADETKPAPAKKKIVLIAGPKSHGPVGNRIHDYPWSVKLLHVLLESSNVKDAVRVEHHFDGWPKDERTLEDADTIVILSDGRDGDKYREAPHLESPQRVAAVQKLMSRGCGLVTIHFSNFASDAYADHVLDWTGGYFDWETDGKRQWYSAITEMEADVKLATADHPILKGVKPFRLKEEFYHNLRFNPQPGGYAPLLTVPALPGREPDGRVVAWARQRPGPRAGRGFGTTCGHYYDNWKNDDFRKLVLNAIVWTAGGNVPAEGVQAAYVEREEIERKLGAEGEKAADEK